MSECLQTYVQRCKSLSIGGPWRDCAGANRGFIGPDDTESVLQDLTAAHPEQLLLDAGMVQRNQNGKLSLHPYLARPQVIGVAYPAAPAATTRILTNDGWLPGLQRPLQGLLDEPAITAMLAEGDLAIVLAKDLTDAVLLDCFDITSVPVNGLETMGPEVLFPTRASQRTAEFQSPVALPTNPSAATIVPISVDLFDTELRPTNAHSELVTTNASATTGQSSNEARGHARFIIAAWAPAALSLEVPQPVQKMIDYFRIVQEFENHPKQAMVERLEVWTPTPSNLNRLRRAVAFNDHSFVTRALRESLAADCVPLTSFLGQPPRPTPNSDLADACRAFSGQQMKGPAFGDDGQQRLKRRTVLLERHRKCVSEPLLEEAQAATNPLVGSLYFQLAMHSQIGAQQFADLHDDAVGADGNAGEQRTDGIHAAITNSTCIVSIARVLTTWNRPNNRRLK